jgi:hypothetical protein
VPSTHDQMIECDWTCERYASGPAMPLKAGRTWVIDAQVETH